MPLPTRFDQNEIFLLIIAALLMLVTYIIPKRFPYSISCLIVLFNISIGIAMDHLLAGPPMDFYDVLDTKKFELFDLFLYVFVYGPSTYIFVYVYDLWFFHRPYRVKVIYLILLALINVVLEYVSGLLHVFTYKGWEIYYSFIVYILMYTSNFMLLSKLKKDYKIS
ncbi:hypothetical protein RCG23_09270 [Neobacillus sp. PS3-34]|uniref:hypothetical protein n=1 Tax=Neobacillus sp. PS3-34 TaxID=3070678 RepID=UPI0027DF30C5|nr:hypothetical protein [Neobacillus sp. PS3-34]WML50014.1 hypothetical protein RCG23_09270 [Neobacillus sp. PS3-34]